MSSLFKAEKRGILRSRRMIVLGIALLVVLAVGSTLVTLAFLGNGVRPGQSQPGHGNGKPTATSTSAAKQVTPTPQGGASFTFTAAGDYGQTVYTTDVLKYIAHAGVSFHLALGDFSYDLNVSAATWSAYAKSILPPNFPFEIVSGGHDSNQIDTYAADLPDHLGHITGTYAKQYTFDYPPGAPLARFIIVSPSGVLSGYNYNKGTAGYNWVSQMIDGARAAKIHWVIVAMHQYCFVIDSTSCAGQDLLDLLLSKHVDLILQAQKHTYQASKQLALNANCTSLSITSYNSHCVVNASTSMTKGAGSVIVVSGTGGTTDQLPINTSDPKIGYFRAWMGANVAQSWGVSEFTISPTELSMHFVAVSGSFSDSFTIKG